MNAVGGPPSRFRGIGLVAALCGLTLLAAAAPLPDFDARKQGIRDVLRKADYKQADALATALLAEAETAYGKESAEVASVLDVLVQVRFEGGHATEAESLELAQRAVRLR